MATVSSLTKDRMLAIEAASVVSGEVDVSGDLILTKHDGSQFNAGHVAGEDGDDATALLDIQDTTSVDLTKTGSGTPLDPWVVKADVKTTFLEPYLTLTGVVKSRSMFSVVVTTTLGDITVPTPKDAVWTGDRVSLDKNAAGTYVITSVSETFTSIGMLNNWTSYSDFNSTDEYGFGTLRNQIGVTLRNGFVHLHALVQGGTVTALTTIAILPAGMRPDYTMLFQAETNGVLRSIYVLATGEIQVGPNFQASAFISLDDIIFPVAGRATWIPIGTGGSTFASGWVDYGNAAYGPARYWVDEFGIIWFGGLIKNGTTADLTPMVHLPSALAAGADPCNQLFSCVSADVFGYLGYGIVSGSATKSSLVFRGGNNAWVSLCGITARSGLSDSLIPWRTPRTLSNSWTAYNSGYPTMKQAIRGDGMFWYQGLICNGTVGPSVYFAFADWEGRYSRTSIRMTAAGSARARVDFIGTGSSAAPKGSLNPNSGSNAWLSLENLKGFAVRYSGG